MAYIGGKSQSGTFQRIINLIPPHRTYIEPFAGSAAILRLKAPAESSHVVDLDPEAIRSLDLATPIPALKASVGCGIEFLSAYRFTGSEFVYADPPYVLSTRSRSYYRHEMSDADHIRLLRVLITLPCPVLLSGYASDLYRSEGFGVEPGQIREGWACDTFRVMTRGHVWRTECLWRNYPRPSQLHDVRYVGEDFRDRWRIEKRRRRWRARLLKLDPLERATLFAALVDVMNSTAASAECGAAAGGPQRRIRRSSRAENKAPRPAC